MNQTELKGLLDKYINGTCSKEETVLLESWYLSKSKQDKWTLKDDDELYLYRKLIWENVQQNTGISQKLKNRRSYQLWSKILVAASIVCVLSVGSYYMFYENPKELISQNSVKHDLLPGGDKAVLVLSNGKQISLGSAQNGIIAKEENTLVQKNGSNVLSYKESAQYSDNKGQPVYNTVRTPNGGQWPIIELPDGTKAILDAGSSISFPVSFNQERKVTITGQVYFQVVHNSNKPFRVAVNGVTIEDIGTEFNVNAYNDEPLVKTTLIEGSISVVKKAQKMVLKPGQQAITEPGTDRIRSREVNIEEVVAWKNGLFQFNHTHIDVVMRQIARWYDVEIVYKDDVSNVSFSGNLSRNLKASRLLEMMSVTGLHFKIENKKIIVMR
ncbi:FecR family protein [Pedobacter nutrimenti]|uniref:FecR family protein n=1 Tax=Pedobacter nutrimenti TaxID=1241337 RepID=UPI00292D3BE8|nr:FecR domain-containing protein [Pedobacter nutrimenti]